ncbi:translation initiation factor IF-2 [Anoxybacterium hadale]|uniref:Translation initiation factor IF-2 n=2 Tax=Anoxybacterium hadale TaxID=3408580 RepID=A0ACD1AI62_9FIRM|nr:translation initiation factor IF-2 [Clostridiales bacterium]
MKIHELAKELNMSSKDMLDKINTMGIDAKSHMSVLSDMDVIAIKNTVLRGKSGSETKIVKAAPKKTEVQDKEEVKVVVKAAAHPSASPESKAAQKPAGARPTQPQQQTQQPQPSHQQHQQSQHQQPQQRAPQSNQTQSHGVQQQDRNHQTQNQGNNRPAQHQQQRPAQNNQAQRPAQGNNPQTQRPNQGYSQAQRPGQNNSQAQRPSGGYQQQRPAQQGQQGQYNQSNQSGQQGQQRSSQNYSGQNQRPAQSGQYGQQRPSYGGQQRPSYGQQSDQNRSSDDRNAQRPRTGEQRDHHNKPGESRQFQPRTDQRSDSRPDNREQRPDQRAQNPRQKPGTQTNQQRSTQGGNQQRPNNNQQRPNLQRPAQRSKPRPKPAPKPVEPEINLAELPPGTKIINVPITVAGLADQIEKSTSQVIMALMKLGIMANINQNIDEDTVVILGSELGVNIVVGKVEEEIVEEGLELFKDQDEDLKSRPPIITVMGHVDHGKTSLLDAIRKTNVTASESGGITQHIGASEVYANGQKIVFLDTPGHEAFTAMRARGAHVTDIAVLVVAADDSVKPQTVEAISHAKAAGVPIIVAINKMDKPGADPTRVKQDLTEHNLLIEEWGGDIICVPVSAKTGEGIDTLLEMILLQAEVLELKANPNRLAMGSVIEARLDKTRGPVATLLVLNGTLQAGMSVVAGTSSGRIKAMTNFKGDAIRKAGPATAVEILGLTEVPEAGDEFNAVKEDKVAREIAENRKSKLREEVMARNSSITLEQLFSQIQEGEVKELNLIIKGDVQGSVGALTQSLEKLKNENVKVKIIHTGVGTVTESDIMLANTSGAIVIAFNVRPSTAITSLAEREKVEIRTYRVIYDAIDEVESAMKGMLDPVFKEVVLGKIEIRNTFKVPGVGIIGGAYVLEGKVLRNAEIRLVRDGIVIHEGKISSLKRFKDDVKEVNHGYECGIGIENYNDIKEGDIIEAFKMEQIERK